MELNKFGYILAICYSTQFQHTLFYGAGVILTPQLRPSVTLVTLVVEN
jgi:hypothetical protein